MTKSEIQAALEGMKDLTNDAGKVVLEGLKVAVGGLRDAETEKPGEPPTEDKPPVIETVQVDPGDRREYVRDPGEVEQHLAEKLKLVPEAR